MHILYILAHNSSPLLQNAPRLIRGRNRSLAEFRDEEDGLWFPQRLEAETTHAYSLCAGRWHEEPDLKRPAHFPDGNWLALKFDKQSDELLARSDPFLQCRWYFGQIGEALVLSNSLRCLARHQKNQLSLNWHAAPQVLRFGYLTGAQTPFENIFSLRSGETLCVRDGDATVELAALVPPARVPRDVSTLDIRDVLASAVRSDIGDSETIVVPISGGMDSRIILRLALDVLPREAIYTVTFGHPTSLDFRIGRQVAHALGVRNTALPMDTRPLAEQVAENFTVGEGMYCVIPEYPVKPLHDALPEHSLILSGYIGDVVFGSFEPEEELTTLHSAREYLHETVGAVPESVVQRLFSDVSADVLQAASFHEGEPFLRQYEQFIYDSHQMNRTNFALFVHRRKVCYATPFVQAHVLQLAYSLPALERRNESAFFAMVREHFPELWKLPLKSSFGYPPEHRQARRTMLIRSWRKLLATLDQTLGARFGKILYRHPRLNYAHPREWLAYPHRDFVIHSLERLSKLPPFETRALRTLRDDVAAGKPLDSSVLKGLITLSQWDEQYGASQ